MRVLHSMFISCQCHAFIRMYYFVYMVIEKIPSFRWCLIPAYNEEPSPLGICLGKHIFTGMHKMEISFWYWILFIVIGIMCLWKFISYFLVIIIFYKWRELMELQKLRKREHLPLLGSMLAFLNYKQTNKQPSHLSQVFGVGYENKKESYARLSTWIILFQLYPLSNTSLLRSLAFISFRITYFHIFFCRPSLF